MASIVEMRQAQIALARAMGDDSLLAFLRRLQAGGREGAEFNTIRIRGRGKGIGAKASALIGREPHLNDATANMLPFKPTTVYTASDSMLKLRKTKAKDGNHGPEIATIEKLKALDRRHIEWNITPGVEFEHISTTIYQFEHTELASFEHDKSPNEVGCVATNHPEYEIPHGF